MCLKIRHGHRTEVNKALYDIAAQLLQRFHLSGVLDPLGHSPDAEPLCQLQDRLDDQLALVVQRGVCEKAAVEFDHIDIQLFQQPQGGVARPEVVQ